MKKTFSNLLILLWREDRHEGGPGRGLQNGGKPQKEPSFLTLKGGGGLVRPHRASVEASESVSRNHAEGEAIEGVAAQVFPRDEGP